MQEQGRRDGAGDSPGMRNGAAPRGIAGWLPAGLGLRPWAALLVVSLALLGLAGAMLLTNLYRMFIIRQTGVPLVYQLTLQFIPHPWREILVGGHRRGRRAGRLSRAGARRARGPAERAPHGRPGGAGATALLPAPPGPAHRLHRRRAPASPPCCAASRRHTDYITAVVTVADDGGSSGRLRRDLGILPPGDFRNCLVALSDVEPLHGQSSSSTASARRGRAWRATPSATSSSSP